MRNLISTSDIVERFKLSRYPEGVPAGTSILIELEAKEAVSKIGLSYQEFTQSVRIPLDEKGHAPKPDGYDSLVSLNIVFPDEVKIQPGYAGFKPLPVYDAASSKKFQAVSTARYQEIVLAEDRNCFFFLSGLVSDAVALDVVYIGLMPDGSGGHGVMVPQAYANAIDAYLDWRELKRERRRNRVGIPMSEIKDAEDTWLKMSRAAINEMKAISVADIAQSAEIAANNFPTNSLLRRYRR